MLHKQVADEMLSEINNMIIYTNQVMVNKCENVEVNPKDFLNLLNAFKSSVELCVEMDEVIQGLTGGSFDLQEFVS